MRIPIIVSLLLVVPVVIVSCTSRALVTTQVPVAARQLKVDAALAQTKVECANGDATIARMGKLLTPSWERVPKSAPPANHPELRRPLRRVRLAWDAVGNFNSEKSLAKFGRALELFAADLDKHHPRELGIAIDDYAAIKGDIARLRGNAVANAIETIKANENTGAGEKKKVRA